VRAFEAECDHVYRALRRHGVSRQDAPDLVQEVLLVMWRRWGEFDTGRALRPWLAGIAFKVAHAHHRRFWRREIPSEGVEPAAAEPGPEERLAHARAQELFLRALERLPDGYRSVLVMHDIDGISVRDIASLAERPRFTVHTQLRRARGLFEKIVRALEAERRDAWGAALSPAVLLGHERRPPAAPPEVRSRLRALALLPSPPLPIPVAARPWGWAAVAGVAVVGLVGVTASVSRSPRPAASGATLPLRAPAPATGPGTGLAGHWTFDDAVGSRAARDLSGRGHDCLLHGLDPASAWVPGQRGGAVDLGRRGWLECPQPAAAGRGPVAMTVALWVKRERPRAITTFIDRDLDPEGDDYVHFRIQGNTLQLWSGVWSRTTTHALAAPLEGWTHLAFTHAGNTTRIFVGGRLVAERRDTGIKGAGVPTGAPLIVGAAVQDPTQVWQHLDGAVDDLRLYERALTTEEVAALASALP
jgi:RNA polymerase sigma-70 factor (ECF subfamily)